ncbi:hypothetical protein ACQBAU_04770 [Propionibacteriaceae bacterium Y2011]|uniref:hypothetical protein n=1 Tax=Microlunatus sp. Y2014 TaxID=3418488 RepID=UPI003B48DF5C
MATRGWVARIRDTLGHPKQPDDESWPPLGLDDLDTALTDIIAETGSTVVLAHHVAAAAARGVPVSYVQPFPAPGAARIGFADGAVMIAHSPVEGDLGRVAIGTLHPRRVRILAWQPRADRVSVRFGLPRGEVTVDLLGFDQAD